MGNCCSQEVDFNAEPTLFHFDLGRAVGKGAFGKVRIIEHKRSKVRYALKYINKSQAIKQKAINNIIQERRILEEIDHPYICNMRYAFQDDENCFMVLDLALGGDLRFHISKSAPFSEKVVRIWTAELASAVEYLHRQRIIHRDIKPDNILLDEQGHVHLTDFNVAMHFSSRRLHTSVGGSLAYMAPEMLSKRTASSGERKPTGYTWCVDWWSLGVTVFEMLYGRRPYEGKTATVMKQSIVAGEARYGGVPGTNIQLSAACLDVLHGLLERDPFRRLGCRPNGQGLTDVQQHAWFAGLDWAALPSKAVPSAYVPDPKEANFDPTHELDEFLMLEKPLAKRSRKEGVDIEKMSPERRELELEFTVYDFSAMQRMTYFPPDDGKSRAPSPATVAPRPSTQSARPNRQTSGQSQSPVPGLRPNSSDTALDTNFDDGASLVPTATILENRSVTVMAHAQPVNPQLQETPPPLPSLLTTPGSSSMRVPQR